MKCFDKIFAEDRLSKRERVELTLNLKPVDRVAILEGQLGYNPGVISAYNGKAFQGFNYGLDDICEAIRKTTDIGPDILEPFHYPYIRNVAQAWHEHGIKALYHSDGNYKSVLPQLMDCEVDGFYCLEKNAEMDIVELKNTYPGYVWSGGVDGVDLLERGTPEDVTAEVRRHIVETNALNTGGMFVSSSSEINPPVKVENFTAMIQACNQIRN
jgi:hypothetical protein